MPFLPVDGLEGRLLSFCRLNMPFLLVARNVARGQSAHPVARQQARVHFNEKRFSFGVYGKITKGTRAV